MRRSHPKQKRKFSNAQLRGISDVYRCFPDWGGVDCLALFGVDPGERGLDRAWLMAAVMSRCCLCREQIRVLCWRRRCGRRRRMDFGVVTALHLDGRNFVSHPHVEELFKGLSPWVNWLPGRLMHVNVIGCGIFGMVSGSSAATCATIAKIALPELKKRGYNENLAIGSLAGSGTLGLLIPPSITMIVYAFRPKCRW